MTRQHFQAIADVIAEIVDPDERKRTAYLMAIRLSAFNERFDKRRFVQACGV